MDRRKRYRQTVALMSMLSETKTIDNVDIATFDGNGADLLSLIVGIDPVQAGSGDPSPDNVRPISGWDAVEVEVTGINIWDEEWENGYIDGSGMLYEYALAIRSKNYCACKPNTRYYLKKPASMTGHGVAWYTKNKQFIERITNTSIVTAPNDAYFFKLSLYNYKSDGRTEYLHDVSLNYPSTDTYYHAGHVQSVPITFPSEAGTVYGGTLDVTNGTLTVDRAFVRVADSSIITGSTSVAGTYRYTIPVAGIKRAADANVLGNLICSSYPNVTALETYRLTLGASVSHNSNAIYIYDPEFATATVEEFKTAKGDVQLVYELATPITINLDPVQIATIAGQTNNVWADTGKIIFLEYEA